MANVKAADQVCLPNGDVMTLGEAIDCGRLVVEFWPQYLGPSGTRKQPGGYVAREPGTSKFFEISKMLYLSRTGQVVHVDSELAPHSRRT